LKDGAIQKLVLKAVWGERRWNDRRLVLYKNKVCYMWNRGDKAGDKPIDQIKAGDITHLAAMYEETNHTSSPVGSPALRKSHSFAVDAISIWDTVSLHRHEHAEELQSCFLLRTQAADGTRREYVFRAETQEDARSWVEQLRGIVEAAKPPPISLLGRFRRGVYDVFHSKPFQVFILNPISLCHATQYKATRRGAALYDAMRCGASSYRICCHVIRCHTMPRSARRSVTSCCAQILVTLLTPLNLLPGGMYKTYTSCTNILHPI
jgi:hypothetical protein